MDAMQRSEAYTNEHSRTAQIASSDWRSNADAASLRSATALRDVRLLLIGLWLGAAIFFGGAVAPSVFAVLAQSRELAGAIVSRTLTIVNVGGFIIGLVLLISAPFFRRMMTTPRAFRAEMIALTLLVLTTGVGQWIITARLEQLRVAMGRAVDSVAANDPLRVAFGQWHVYSVITLGVGIVGGVVAFLLIARRVPRTDFQTKE
jgi:hypothetical protein